MPDLRYTIKTPSSFKNLIYSENFLLHYAHSRYEKYFIQIQLSWDFIGKPVVHGMFFAE